MRRLGLKRQRLDVYRQSSTVNGSGEAIESFTKVNSVWAEVKSAPGNSIDQQGRFVVDENAVDVYVRKESLAGFTSADYLQDGTTVYQPVGAPVDSDGMGRELRVRARIVDPSTR